VGFGILKAKAIFMVTKISRFLLSTTKPTAYKSLVVVALSQFEILDYRYSNIAPFPTLSLSLNGGVCLGAIPTRRKYS